MQGEPSLGAGLDVAQEQEEGGERTDWQVRLMINQKTETKQS